MVMQKRFLDVFQKLCYRRHSWQIWCDFIQIVACTIANRFDKENYDKREQVYLTLIQRFEKDEHQMIAELFAIIVMALERNPEQDFLGSLFQTLELHNHWNGQFFSPYSISQLMAETQMTNIPETIREKGYISVSDPACGAGSLLIAFANAVRKRKINYQDHVFFVAQDVDLVAGLMCYIQLSLLGCSGMVIIGDTLARPGIHPENDIWYMPMYYEQIWVYRRLFDSIQVKMKKPEEGQPVQLTLF